MRTPKNQFVTRSESIELSHKARANIRTAEFNEPAALGCQIKWENKTELPMYISHPWIDTNNAIIPKDLLDRKPISTYLEAIRIAKKDYGDKIAVLGKIMGPFSMTQVMYGIENIMTGMIDSPEKIEYFINMSASILIKCANAQFESGIDALAIGEGGQEPICFPHRCIRDFS